MRAVDAHAEDANIVRNVFAIFKNVVHSLEPGEASHQAPNYAQRS